MVEYRPHNTQEVCDIVASALSGGTRLEIIGGGTRADFGAPDRQADHLCLQSLSGILDYDPAELVLTARTGTSLAEVKEAVATRGQALAFEPWGKAAATLGGSLVAGVAGPRRLSAGAARDHLLGFEAVSGRAEIFRAGAKVVKNVTGYDLPKLVCGSWGRLVALTEVTLKVLPCPQKSLTLAWQGLEDEQAFGLMRGAVRLPVDVAAAAHSPGAYTLVRLDGFAPSVAARMAHLRTALAHYPAPEVLDSAGAAALWAKLEGGAGLPVELPLWRLSLPPRRALAALEPLQALGGRYLADWAGGLVWLTLLGHEEYLRNVVAGEGGHATLIRAPAEIRARVPALHPLQVGVEALSRRVRCAFDPLGVFEINRFLDVHHAD